MANVFSMPRPEDYKRAHQRIRKLWADGLVEIRHHAQQRMKERKRDMTDIDNVIKYGQITGHSKPMTLWRYTLDGKDVDGKRMRCVVEIDGSLIIVTVV